MSINDDDFKTAVLNRSNPVISEALEPRAPAGRLTRLDGAGQATSNVFLLAAQTQTIGRDATNAIRLNTVGISRAHARIYSDSGGWMVQDLASRNGVWVNGTRIEQPTRVSNGDQIQLSEFVLRLDLQDASPANSAEEVPGRKGGFRVLLDREETADLDTKAIRAGILATVGASATTKTKVPSNDPVAQTPEDSIPNPVHDLIPIPDLVPLLAPHADAIVQTLIDKATEGEPGALRLIVDRLWPAPSDAAMACAPHRSLLARAQQLIHEYERGEVTSDDAESALRSTLFGPEAD